VEVQEVIELLFQVELKLEFASGTTVPITVGAGGATGGPSVKSSSGNDSVFDIITSTGGGRGGGFATPGAAEFNVGDPGGSGGGGGGATCTKTRRNR
jgi:hypothetical protein